VLRKESFGYLVFDSASYNIFELNAVGAEIFALLNGQHTVEKINSIISDKYGVPLSTVQGDVAEFLKQAADTGILEGTHPSQRAAERKYSLRYDKTLSAPLAVNLDVTNRCNLNCIECYANSGPHVSGEGELDTDKWKSLIDELGRLSVFIIGFGGGEPLLRADILQIAEHARRKNMYVSLSTNGTLVSREKAQALKDVGFRNVQVSIDGPTEAVQDSMRGRGSFKTATRAVEFLVDSGIAVTMSSVVTRLNMDGMCEMMKLASRLGASNLVIRDMIPAGRAKENWKSLWIPWQEKEKVLRVLAQERQRFPNMRISLPVLTGDESDKIGECEGSLVGCIAGRAIANIKSNGEVTACSVIRDSAMTAGNIRDQSFQEIWMNSSIIQRFRRISTLTEECSSCALVRSCMGGCRGAAIEYFGSMYSPDPRCKFVEKRLRPALQTQIGLP
jgi:mycofactocin radical SAM maturase